MRHCPWDDTNVPRHIVITGNLRAHIAVNKTHLLDLETIKNANSLRPRQDGRNFADDTFQRIFLNENVRISIKIPLKFVPKGQINNILAPGRRQAIIGTHNG